MNLHWERRRILRQEKLNGGKKNLARRRAFNRQLALQQNKPFLRGGLDLWNRNLTVLPEIENPSTLERLDVSANQLSTLPRTIGNLRALRVLEVRNNILTTLPKEINNLTALEELNISRNQLTTLPEIGNLTALEELDVSYNQLTTLPEIGNLTALKRLDVTKNRLTSLPAEIGNLSTLEILNVSANQLTTLPTEIGRLTALKIFIISNNQLTTLPTEIGNLTTLFGLHVSRNRLTTLPVEIGRLTALKRLDVSKNQLTILPAVEIGSLTALEELNISFNQLVDLPEIGSLRALKKLYVQSNSFTYIYGVSEVIASLIEGKTLTVNSDVEIMQRLKEQFPRRWDDDYDGVYFDDRVLNLEDDAPDFQTGDGRAWEVHNVFKEKYDEFRENIDVMKEFVGDWDVEHWISNSWLEYIDLDLEDLKQQVNTSHEARFTVLYAYLHQMIEITYDYEQAPPEKRSEIFRKRDLSIQQLFQIFHRLSGQKISGQMYVYSLLAMKFILKINNPVLTEEYISRFVDECVNAYGPGQMSCVRGIRERLILVFDGAFKSLCCQQGLCVNDNIDQGKIDTLCPVNVRLILDAVKNNEKFWTYSWQWVSANEDLELKDRRAAFIDAMTEKYTEGIQREDVKQMARAAIDKKVQKMEDEKKADFECAEIDDIFDPVDCAKPKEEEEEEAVDASDPQCCCMAGKGKTARRCSRQHKKGSPYCAQHAKVIKKHGKCSNNGPTPLC